MELGRGIYMFSLIVQIFFSIKQNFLIYKYFLLDNIGRSI